MIVEVPSATLIQIKRPVPNPSGGTKRRSYYGRTKEEAERKWTTELDLLARPAPPKLLPGSFGWWLVIKWAPLKSHRERGTRDIYDRAAKLILARLANRPIGEIDATVLTEALQ